MEPEEGTSHWPNVPKSENIDFYNNVNNYIGLIVYSTGDYKTYSTAHEKLNIDKEAITINDSLPIIDLSNKKKL